MKTLISLPFRPALLAAVALSLLPSLVCAHANAAPDTAADLLATKGWVTVKNAGHYVERGTYRIQVATKLGRPDAQLSDGTWLYHRRAIDGSAATGTLVVRFDKGRVRDLAVATPVVVAALQADPRTALPVERLASK